MSDMAVGSKREMTDVLYQKFAYSGGTPKKAKQLAQARHAPQVQTAFTDMYSSIVEEKNVDPDEVFAKLSSILDVQNLHPKILAVAQFLITKYDIKDPSKITFEGLKSWMTTTYIWGKLIKGLAKEPTPSLDAQVADIFRYIVMILNYRKA